MIHNHQTRASCTDYKISIPGPHGLLYFLVPRCSLLDPEVAKDVDIVDCGVATRDEIQRAIGDLEAINLDSTTLGMIRQLTGIQLMREGQVGYLPPPDDPLPEDSFQQMYGRTYFNGVSSAQDVSSKLDLNPPSSAGSSQVAPLSYESALSPLSSSESSLSDITTKDEQDTPGKRSRVSQADEDANEISSKDEDADKFGKDLITPSPPPPKSIRSPKVSSYRKRKLKPEDAAYKPEVEATESSSDSGSIGGKKKNRRSSKRRTSEMPTPVDGTFEDLKVPSPKKTRKRKDADQPNNFEGPLDSSESRRKKARRKKNDDAGNYVAPIRLPY